MDSAVDFMVDLTSDLLAEVISLRRVLSSVVFVLPWTSTSKCISGAVGKFKHLLRSVRPDHHYQLTQNQRKKVVLLT